MESSICSDSQVGDCGLSSAQMTLKQIKKTNRKLRRFQETISKQDDIQISMEPTNTIVICNAGQATGLTSEGLFIFITKYLPRDDVTQCILPKGKSHCFLKFRNIHDATAFYIKAHGINGTRPDGYKGVLYLSYIKSVPLSEAAAATSITPPPGLTLIQNFLSKDEENSLYSYFDWENNEAGSYLKQRLVRHFGYEFRYGSNDVDKSTPLNEKIPGICDFLWKRLEDHGVKINEAPDQLTVNKYNAGQGIPPHVDTHSPFGPMLISISLGAAVVMDWKHWSGKDTFVHLPNRSVLIMEGESRYDWLHSIAARTWDPIIDSNGNDSQSENFGKRSRGTRISLTFRWTRSKICQCDYPKLCDRRTYIVKEKLLTNVLDDENKIASTLEELHVHQVYENIAPQFSITRHKAWPRVVDFVKKLPAGSFLLDLGAGNGKNIIQRPDIIQIAVERSSGLLDICMEQCKKVNASDCLRGDVLSVPLNDSIADAVICIAVLHHFANEDRRKNAICEVMRLLRVGGCALITVWARDQHGSSYLKGNFETNTKEMLQSHYVLPGLTLPIHENRTQFQQGDLLVPWKLRKSKDPNIQSENEAVLLRYYHVFEKGELDELCANVKQLLIKESFYEQGNWCIIITKIVEK